MAASIAPNGEIEATARAKPTIPVPAGAVNG